MMGIWVEPESIFQYENIYRPRHTVPSIISLAPRGGDLPSTVSHFLAGATLALPFTGVLSIREAVRPAGLMFSASLLAAAPDLDTISFGLIPYGHFFGHRGFFHSPFFAICSALTLSCLLFALSRSFTIGASLGIAAAFALAIASHGILDAMTNDGLGVMLFYPFSDERIFFSWRPFHAPPENEKTLRPSKSTRAGRKNRNKNVEALRKTPHVSIAKIIANRKKRKSVRFK